MSSGELLREQLQSVLQAGDHDSALALLQRALAEEPHNVAFKVELADVLALKGDLEGARATLATLPDDTEEIDDLHALAIRAGAEGAYEVALEAALELMMRDRQYGDELGRRTLIRLFSVLGKGHPLAKTYRRRMFAALH